MHRSTDSSEAEGSPVAVTYECRQILPGKERVAPDTTSRASPASPFRAILCETGCSSLGRVSDLSSRYLRVEGEERDIGGRLAVRPAKLGSQKRADASRPTSPRSLLSPVMCLRVMPCPRRSDTHPALRQTCLDSSCVRNAHDGVESCNWTSPHSRPCLLSGCSGCGGMIPGCFALRHA
ncbi:hypothetical protein OH77DRAFT_266581 [Trametes cingulata]|nr:hypothetical protein OH77DRAFT_266581 [Trametes cingulata]